MALKINQFWLEGLKGPERANMQHIVTNNTILLDKLTEMLYNMKEGKESLSTTDYDSPSWSHKQAHLNGERAALQKIIDMIKVHEREDPPSL